MAGLENDVLDMGMINFGSQEQTLDETPVNKEVLSNNEENITEEVPVKNVDDESQEVVDKDEGNPPEDEDSQVEKKTESPANSDDVFTPLAEFLKEQGFFPTLEKEIKTADDLAEAFKEEIQRNEYADLNEDQINYLKALREGVPDTLYREHVQTSNVFNSITDEILEEDEDIRKRVIIEDLLSNGVSQERAERQYQRIYDVGDSLEEAKLAKANLMQKEEKAYQQKVQEEKQRAIAYQKAQEKQMTDLRNAVFEQTKLFDSFNVTDGLKNKVYKTMTEPVAYTEDRQPLNKLMKHRMDNPIDFETKLYYLYELTDGFKNIQKFITKSSTTAAQKLKDAVAASTIIKSGGEGNFNQQGFISPPIIDL